MPKEPEEQHSRLRGQPVKGPFGLSPGVLQESGAGWARGGWSRVGEGRVEQVETEVESSISGLTRVNALSSLPRLPHPQTSLQRRRRYIPSVTSGLVSSSKASFLLCARSGKW